MRKNKIFYAILWAIFGVAGLASCKKRISNTDDGGTTTTPTVTDDGFVTNTKDTTFTNTVVIKYDSGKVTVSNAFSATGVSVAVSGSGVVDTATIT